MISAFQKKKFFFHFEITKGKTKTQTSSFKKFWLKQLIFPLYIWPRVTLSGNLSTLGCDRKFQQPATKEDEALGESVSGENLPRATSSSSLGFLLMGRAWLLPFPCSQPWLLPCDGWCNFQKGAYCFLPLANTQGAGRKSETGSKPNHLCA